MNQKNLRICTLLTHCMAFLFLNFWSNPLQTKLIITLDWELDPYETCNITLILQNNSDNKSTKIERTKLRASRTFVSCVPNVSTCFTCSLALYARVHSCLCFLHALLFLHDLLAFFLLRTLRAFIFLPAFHFYMSYVLYLFCLSSFLYAPYVPHLFMGLTLFFMCLHFIYVYSLSLYSFTFLCAWNFLT